MTAVLFSVGRVMATPGALEAMDTAGVNWAGLLARHVAGDWHDMTAEDAEANAQAIQDGDRVLSAYELPGGVRVWVLTEWDRSMTTLLLPDEY